MLCGVQEGRGRRLELAWLALLVLSSARSVLMLSDTLPCSEGKPVTALNLYRVNLTIQYKTTEQDVKRFELLFLAKNTVYC